MSKLRLMIEKGMSMTENEVKGWLEYIGNMNLPYDRSPKSRKLACDAAIKALEEIQQYRAIGTVEEVKSIVYIGKWGYKKGYNEAIDEFAEQMKELVYKWIDKGIIAVGCIDEIAEQLKAGEKE